MGQVSVEEFVARQGRYTLSRRFLRMLIRTAGFHLATKTTVSGVENVPADGPCILMMNHVSLLDPVACVGAIPHRFVVPMSKIENSHKPIIGPLLRMYGVYTVDRNIVDRKALMNSIELVKSGMMILIAPEGTRRPEGLTHPKHGLAYVATKSDAVIVPGTVSGKVDFLNQWKHFRRAIVHVNFGRPFKFKTNGEARIPRDTLSRMSEEAMYQLALALPDPNLRGVYSNVENATTEYLEFIEAGNG